MRTFLWWLFVAAACTPITIMALIAAEARYPTLDHITLHNPSVLRDFVGEIAMTWVGYGKDSPPRLDRVLRLAPGNAEAWTRRCTDLTNTDQTNTDQTNTRSDTAIATCTKAVALAPVQWNYNNLGRAQQRQHHPCPAEESFNVANMKAAWGDTWILREFGQASLECGHMPAAVHEFEQAEKKDAQQVAVSAAKHEDEEDVQEEKDDLQSDRDWLILAYGRNHDLSHAARMCSTAHPIWHSCSCNTDATTIKCVDPLHPAMP